MAIRKLKNGNGKANAPRSTLLPAAAPPPTISAAQRPPRGSFAARTQHHDPFLVSAFAIWHCLSAITFHAPQSSTLNQVHRRCSNARSGAEGDPRMDRTRSGAGGYPLSGPDGQFAIVRPTSLDRRWPRQPSPPSRTTRHLRPLRHGPCCHCSSDGAKACSRG
jgi:hypothetical protein